MRRDQDRLQLRGHLLAGASSGATAPVNQACFNGLRGRVHSAAKLRRMTHVKI